MVGLVLPRVLEIREQQHKKHGFRSGCDCTYCQMKRRATAEIGHLRYYMHRPDSVLVAHPEVARSLYSKRGDCVAEIIREALRGRYRTLLYLEEHREMDYGPKEKLPEIYFVQSD